MKIVQTVGAKGWVIIRKFLEKSFWKSDILLVLEPNIIRNRLVSRYSRDIKTVGRLKGLPLFLHRFNNDSLEGN